MASIRTKGPQLAVLRAIALARVARPEAALGCVRAAHGERGDDALALVAGAAVRYAARDYQGALEDLERARSLDDALLPRIVEDHVRMASSLGWDQEVRAVLEVAMREQPQEPRWLALATQCFVRGGALEHALETATRARELAPDSVGLGLEVASLLTELGRDEQAIDVAEAVCERLPDGAQRLQLAIARLLRRAGAFERARSRFEQVLLRWPDLREAVVELAELALFRGDVDRALAHVARVGELDPAHPANFRIRGIAEMLRGAPERASSWLDEALAATPLHAPTLVWRAEAAYRLGDDDGAHELLSRATMCADGYLFAAWILRQLLVAREGTNADVPPHRIEEFRDAVVEMVPEADAAFSTRQCAPMVEVLERALDRMRGNRTTTASFIDEAGILRRVRTRSGVRHASRHALQLIRVLPPDQVIKALDRVVHRHPEASLPICHRGELYLWLGDLARARADLEAALRLNPNTRWAWIGLSGIDMLEGDTERALRTCARGVHVMGNTEGPAVFVYRGEAYRRLGRLEEARADLEKVVAITPTRVGGWINLALLHAQMGNGEAFERTCGHLERTAGGLLSDAGREVGSRWWSAGADRWRILEHALCMMRGNRSSSCQTYFTREGALRFVQPHADGVDPHAGDARILDRAQALLSGLGELARRTAWGRAGASGPRS